MKSLKVELKNEADVKAVLATLLHQVLDKQNYELVVAGEIHFDECEPTEEGYVVGSFSFHPWGADAFDCMENIITKTVQPAYMSIALTVEGLQATFEEEVREAFDTSFAKLDDCKSAGSMYVGDNGAFILQYLDTTEDEQNMVWDYLKETFAAKHAMQKNPNGSTMLVEIY